MVKSFKKSRRPRRNNRKRVARVSKPLKAAINKIVHGSQETKYRAQTLRNYSGSSVLSTFQGFTSGITGTGELYSLVPILNQGDSSFSRTGTTVFPRKLRCHINLCTTQNMVSNTDIMVYLFFLECVQVKDFANSSAIPITQLLDDGAGSHTTFDGTSQTSLYRINGNSFRVIRVLKKRMIWNYPQTAQSVAWDPSANHHSISVDIPVPKKFTYATESSTHPSNYAPFFCAGWINNTKGGDTAPGITESVQIEGRAELWFKDS